MTLRVIADFMVVNIDYVAKHCYVSDWSDWYTAPMTFNDLLKTITRMTDGWMVIRFFVSGAALIVLAVWLALVAISSYGRWSSQLCVAAALSGVGAYLAFRVALKYLRALVTGLDRNVRSVVTIVLLLPAITMAASCVAIIVLLNGH